jgi:hypothetical protein
MTAKAYIIDDDSELNIDNKCYIEDVSSEEEKENTKDKNESKPKLEFIVPGCVTGEGCNNCGNCY